MRRATTAKYVDFYLLPVPKKNLAAYRRLARKVGQIYREHGALEYREFVADDRGAGGVSAFARAAGLKRGEVLIGAVVGFTSRRHRTRVNKSFAGDPRVDALVPVPPLFEVKRMMFGGFAGLVDV